MYARCIYILRTHERFLQGSWDFRNIFSKKVPRQSQGKIVAENYLWLKIQQDCLNDWGFFYDKIILRAKKIASKEISRQSVSMIVADKYFQIWLKKWKNHSNFEYFMLDSDQYENRLKIVLRSSQDYLKIVSRSSQDCLNIVSRLSQDRLDVYFKKIKK